MANGFEVGYNNFNKFDYKSYKGSGGKRYESDS